MQFHRGQRLVYFHDSLHKFVTFDSMAALDHAFIFVDGETDKKVCPVRFLREFEQGKVDQEKLSRIHLHLRAAQNQSTFYGPIYSQFKPLPFRAYSDALTILESISQQNGGKLGL